MAIAAEIESKQTVIVDGSCRFFSLSRNLHAMTFQREMHLEEFKLMMHAFDFNGINYDENVA